MGRRKTKYLPLDEETPGQQPEHTDPGRVSAQIRWNNNDRDTQLWKGLYYMERWYKAAREWTRILKMKEFEIKIQLKPGQPIIFDNWRYLHGRTEFSGNRRICGGYSKSSLQKSLCIYRLVVWHTTFQRPKPRKFFVSVSMHTSRMVLLSFCFLEMGRRALSSIPLNVHFNLQ